MLDAPRLPNLTSNQFAGPTAHRRVGSRESNPRSFNPSGGGPRARNAPLVGHPQRPFRPLGAPGLDFSRFWAVLFQTSILGWIFHRFWKDFGSILAYVLTSFQWFEHRRFKHDFRLNFQLKTFCLGIYDFYEIELLLGKNNTFTYLCIHLFQEK